MKKLTLTASAVAIALAGSACAPSTSGAARSSSAAAVAVAEVSGYSGDENGVLVESPPSTAPNAVDGTNPNGNAAYVYVELTQTAERVFTKFFARDNTVTFRSAALANIQNGRPACVLAVHPSASGAISTGGSTTVSLSGCDIAANSISQTAITSTGNGSSVTADCISAVGNVSVNSTYNLTCPAPIANGPVTADPYANVPAPQPSDCTSNSPANQFTGVGGAAMGQDIYERLQVVAVRVTGERISLSAGYGATETALSAAIRERQAAGTSTRTFR